MLKKHISRAFISLFNGDVKFAVELFIIFFLFVFLAQTYKNMYAVNYGERDMQSIQMN